MSAEKKISPLFGRANFTWMLVGGLVMALGMVLMAGGKSEDPNVFDANAVYGFTRITLAPILIVLGLVIEVVAIFKKPSAQ
ncbi:MAG: DUF3098 domain-containing protein [Sphingobacteriia bacterium]|nr:MAG: DUF3098 domain-containing protein [Sphingobacteriia bacterium]